MEQTKYEPKLGFEVQLRQMTEEQYALVIPLPADRQVPDSETLQRLASHDDPTALIERALNDEVARAANLRALKAHNEKAVLEA